MQLVEVKIAAHRQVAVDADVALENGVAGDVDAAVFDGDRAGELLITLVQGVLVGRQTLRVPGEDLRCDSRRTAGHGSPGADDLSS